jgi:hypothetical protein
MELIMADCECLQECPFFNDNMKSIPTTASLLKKQYCQDDYEKCARYMVFKALGKLNVPADLYPYEQERAQKMINK